LRSREVALSVTFLALSSSSPSAVALAGAVTLLATGEADLAFLTTAVSFGANYLS
jgi:hypothetical protein